MRLRALPFAWMIAVLAAWGAAAKAAEQSPVDDMPTMRFAVVRSDEGKCEPVCPEWISAEGAIKANTPAAFKRMLKELKGRRLPLVIHSPGGDVDAAMQLGRMIRKAKLDTAVGKTWFEGCKPEQKDCQANKGRAARLMGHPYTLASMCNSACPLMLSGGLRRFAGLEAYLGVHQVTTVWTKQRIMVRTTYRVVNGKKKVVSRKEIGRKNAGSYTTYEMSKALEKKIAAYLKEMGVDLSILDLAKSTPASTIQEVTVFEAFNAKLVTGFRDARAFTSPFLCERVPAPDNCRLFTVSDLEQGQ